MRIGQVNRAVLLPGALLVALTGALALVGVLTVQKNRLEARYEALRERATSAQPGQLLPWVPVTTLDGDTLTLGAPAVGEPQILLLYTTTCPYCRATVPAWNEIAQRAQGARVLGIQLDAGSAEAYRAEHGLTYEIVAVDSVLARRLVSWYRVRTVPLTLAVGEDGRVRYSRFGQIDDALMVDSVVAVLEAAAEMQGVKP